MMKLYIYTNRYNIYIKNNTVILYSKRKDTCLFIIYTRAETLCQSACPKEKISIAGVRAARPVMEVGSLMNRSGAM